jgi:hypothetical protein
VVQTWHTYTEGVNREVDVSAHMALDEARSVYRPVLLTTIHVDDNAVQTTTPYADAVVSQIWC